MRPQGPGLYGQFNLPANNRIENPLKRTHKEPYALPAQFDPQPDATPLALAIMRKARDVGLGPLETVRRRIDEDATRVARRLAELEKPLPPGEYTCAIQDVAVQDIGRGAGGMNVKMALTDEPARTMRMHLPEAKTPIVFVTENPRKRKS